MRTVGVRLAGARDGLRLERAVGLLELRVARGDLLELLLERGDALAHHVEVALEVQLLLDLRVHLLLQVAHRDVLQLVRAPRLERPAVLHAIAIENKYNAFRGEQSTEQ